MEAKRNNKAHSEAWKHFYPEGNGKVKDGYVLHHRDTTLITRDLKRYNEWRPEDLVMITTEEHSTLHATGVRRSEDTRQKMREAKLGERNHFFGKKHSEETKRKISEARKRQGNFRRGFRHSEETKAKIAESLRND